MKRIITQNELMMFIVENDLQKEYNNDNEHVILFNFIDNTGDNLIGFNSFTDSELTNIRYRYTSLKTEVENKKIYYTFNFVKI